MDREKLKMRPLKALVPILVAPVLVLLLCAGAYAKIDGIAGTTFNLTAKTGHISTADGGSLFIWGFANGAGVTQYPGPTLIVTEGDTVTINLTNELTVPVSIVFPGITNANDMSAAGDQKGLLTWEAAPMGGTATYIINATHPGTYTYYSGTEPDLQIEMGLVGAIIVRPSDYTAGTPVTYSAYGGGTNSDTGYDREYLFLLSEMDPNIHPRVEFGLVNTVDTTTFLANYWFINGRTGPDTMDPAGAAWFPNQPYNAMPAMHPGDRVLLRLIGGGRDLHPYHTHGNHVTILARDGRLLESVPGSGVVDIPERVFTTTVAPGSTADGIFIWTGHNLGWDFYGHGWDIINGTFAFPFTNRADCLAANPITPTPGAGNNYIAGECPGDADSAACGHCREFPVKMPPTQDLGVSAFWSGSPFLGVAGIMPPGADGLNPTSAFTFMWHSHNENEIVNNDLFPGGMLTMIYVEHPDTLLPDE